MKNIKTYYQSFFFSLLLFPGVSASAQVRYTPLYTDEPVQLTDLKSERVGKDFHLSFSLDFSDMKLKSENQATVTPVLKGDNDSIVLPCAVVAGHNRYLRLRRSDAVKEGYRLFRSGKSQSRMPVNVLIPFQEWMLTANIVVHDTISGCSCRPIRSSEFAVATLGLTDNFATNITNAMESVFLPEYVFITPIAEVEKTRQAEGHAYIDFPVNKTEIYPDYRKNPIELANIRDTISMIKNDRDYVITSIYLKGFASPEGPYDNNVLLAQGRTDALAEYIRSIYDFSPSLMHTSWEAEDWGGLVKWLEGSSIPNRKALISIATSSKYDGEYDRREWILKSSYPEQYKWLLANVYPSLRHTDYTVKYSIKSFTTIDEIRAAWNDDPRKMSLNELYKLATSYPVGSQEFIEIFETAAALYPKSPEANLNAAIPALQNGDLTRAERYLKKAGDSPEAIYARGIFSAQKGNFDEAVNLFKVAADAGISQANDALIQIQTSN